MYNLTFTSVCYLSSETLNPPRQKKHSPDNPTSLSFTEHLNADHSLLPMFLAPGSCLQ